MRLVHGCDVTSVVMTHTNREHVIKNETLQAENAKVKTMTRPGKPTAWVLVAHVRER